MANNYPPGLKKELIGIGNSCEILDFSDNQNNPEEWQRKIGATLSRMNRALKMAVADTPVGHEVDKAERELQNALIDARYDARLCVLGIQNAADHMKIALRLLIMQEHAQQKGGASKPPQRSRRSNLIG